MIAVSEYIFVIDVCAICIISILLGVKKWVIVFLRS